MFTATNITSPDEIFKELNEIQEFLDSPYTADNPEACVNRLVQIETYMARAGKLLADSEHHYNSLMASEIAKAIKGSLEDKLKATTLNKYLDGVCANYKYLVTWSERLSRACVHIGQGVITIISKHKAEMQSYGR